MNIKEHIEAGHYERDAAGHALVPQKGGDTAVIVATNIPGKYPLLGYMLDGGGRDISVGATWNAEGCHTADHIRDVRTLLPPPPRTVRRYAALTHEQLDALRMYESDGPARRELEPGKMLAVVEYEVAW